MCIRDRYKYNTLKNELSYGLTRVQFYLSRRVVTLLLMIVVFVVTIGVYLLASLVLLGIPSNEMSMMSLGMTTAQSVQMMMQMLGYYILASFPLWLGALSLAIACYFLIRGSNMAGIAFLALMVVVPAVLNNLGKYVNPDVYKRQPPHWPSIWPFLSPPPGPPPLPMSVTATPVSYTHLDVYKRQGKEMEHRLDEVYITVNKNAIPNDPEKPFVTSGIRVGTPAVTLSLIHISPWRPGYRYRCGSPVPGTPGR